MPLNFGTSGIRGLVSELTDHEVYLFTTAFLLHAQNLPQGLGDLAIGRDLRQSSPKIQLAAQKAALDFGIKAFDCGTIPTPALAFYAQKNGLLALMVTGSHIPADRNGIKFYLKTGETLKKDDQAIFDLYQDLRGKNFKNDLFSEQGELLNQPVPLDPSWNRTEEAREFFKNRFLNFFEPTTLQNLKIIFYEHSGVGREMIPTILEGLGAEVLRLGRSDVFVPVDTEAVEATEQFKGWLKIHQADAVVSTDGDADRPLVVDEQGQVVPGDKLGMLTALFLKAKAIVLPISCNSGIKDIPQFEKIEFTKIGSPFVIQGLNEMPATFTPVVGFEANGGFLLQDTAYGPKNQILEKLVTRDAVLPIVAALSGLNSRDFKLSQKVAQLPARFTASLLVKNCPVEKSKKILDLILQNPSSFLKQLSPQLEGAVTSINELDGLRLTLENKDIIHFRPSGNAPEFRCYVETDNFTNLENIAALIKSGLSSQIALI